jgi:uncharacterized protein (TIGR02246 family)
MSASISSTAAPAMSPPQQGSTAALVAARALVERAIDAFNGRQLDLYFELFTEDVESYTGIHSPLLVQGLPAWKRFISGLTRLEAAAYEQTQTSYRVYNDDTVLCNGYYVFSTVAQDGQAETQTGRASLTCVKVDGAWRIANQHYSSIF